MSKSQDLLQELARRFEWHSTNIYASKDPQNASPLYEHLSLAIAKDDEVLSLVMGADLAQQVSNLLFGAAHYLLLKGATHPLANYYRSLTPFPLQPKDAYPDFRNFVLRYAAEIRELVVTRRVQTNEVRRATCLLPAFELIARQADDQALGLVEIGASAGFHLRFDRYSYDYGSAGRTTIASSELTLHCAVDAGPAPSIPPDPPSTTYRIGIDLNPIDVNDEDAVTWLRALIWPEHVDRAEALNKAIRIARRHPINVLQGDAVELLPSTLDGVPDDVVTCIYHSYMLNQCPRDVREQILEKLKHYGRRRDFYRVSLEWYSGHPKPQLELVAYRDGQVSSQMLAYCESHGRRIEWLAKD